MFLVRSPIVINMPTRGLLAVKTMHAFVQWLENLNIKRKMTSMFVNKKLRYKLHRFFISVFTKIIRKNPGSFTTKTTSYVRLLFGLVIVVSI